MQTSAADRISKFSWCLFEPKFGHFQQSIREHGINYHVCMVTESDPFCRNMQQKYWNVTTILTSIGDMIHHLTFCSQQPKIQGYYAVVTDTSYAHMNKQSILSDLLQTGEGIPIIDIF